MDALKAAEAAKRKEAAREAAKQKQKEALTKQKAERAKHALQVKVRGSVLQNCRYTVLPAGHNVLLLQLSQLMLPVAVLPILISCSYAIPCLLKACLTPHCQIPIHQVCDLTICSLEQVIVN